jgi:hypothetical protein
MSFLTPSDRVSFAYAEIYSIGRAISEINFLRCSPGCGAGMPAPGDILGGRGDKTVRTHGQVGDSVVFAAREQAMIAQITIVSGAQP